jgi:hypothetical protein
MSESVSGTDLDVSEGGMGLGPWVGALLLEAMGRSRECGRVHVSWAAVDDTRAPKGQVMRSLVEGRAALAA